MEVGNQPAENQKSGDDEACGEASFERSLHELEAIVHELEDGRLGLADALARYEQGVKRLKHCYTLLEAAERKIELLTGVADDGTPISEPFHESDESLANSVGRRKRGKRAKASNGDDSEKDDIGA